MSRTPNQQPAPSDDGLDPTKIEAKLDSSAQLAVMTKQADLNAQSVAVKFGYQGEMTVGAIEDGIRYSKARAEEALLSLGVHFLLLKEMVGHGEFVKRIELYGFDKRTAQRYMSITLRYGNTSGKLVGAAKSQAKLLALAVLDDDDIAALENGESVNGLVLDDVERMSAGELRETVRKERAEARAEAAAKDKLLDQKNKKIDTLEAKGSVIADIDWTAALAGLSAQFANAHETIKLELTKANAVRDKIQNTEHTDDLARAAYKALLTTHSNQLAELDSVVQLMMRDADVALQGVEA